MRWFWFAGRVRRRTFCIVVAPLVLLNCAVLYLTLSAGHSGSIGLALMSGLLELYKILGNLFGKASDLVGSILTYGFMLALPLYLWLCLATAVKRFHDRNKSGWRLHLLFYPTILLAFFYVCGSLGIALPLGLVANGPLAAELISLLAGIWFFIELAFFPGTEGPNRYGPEPSS